MEIRKQRLGGRLLKVVFVLKGEEKAQKGVFVRLIGLMSIVVRVKGGV